MTKLLAPLLAVGLMGAGATTAHALKGGLNLTKFAANMADVFAKECAKAHLKAGETPPKYKYDPKPAATRSQYQVIRNPNMVSQPSSPYQTCIGGINAKVEAALAAAKSATEN